MVDPETLERALVIAGAVVPLLSAVASLFNHIIRKRLEAKLSVSSFLSGVGTIVNLAAINLDKAVQLARLVQGKPAAPVPLSPESKTPVVPPPSGVSA